MAKELAKNYGLLSPLYDLSGFSKRQGCWFCPNSNIKQFASIKKMYPFLWKELQDLNELYRLDSTQFATYSFKYGRTFDEIEKEVDKINSQLTLFDFMESDNEKQSY